MENLLYKFIELEDYDVNHQLQFPYTDELPGKPYLFSLRTKKTLNWEPCLIIDYNQEFDSLLPLCEGVNIKDEKYTNSCKLYRGEFTKDGQWTCTINNLPTGIINYQLIFTNYGQNIVESIGCHDAILVRQKHLNLRTLRAQTVFGRCIGTYQQWIPFFKKQVELGYNAFHLAPIQQTGSSNSYYSIFDQLQLSDLIFKGTSEQKYEQLQNILKPFKKQGVTFFVDIVLNHTSFDSQWIKKETNGVFTLENTPILRSAYQIDSALRKWGNKIKLACSGSQMKMDEDQYDQLKRDLQALIDSLKLYEYFMLDEKIKDSFLEAVPTSQPSQNIFAKDPSQIVLQFVEQYCSYLGCERFGVKIQNLQQKWKQQNVAYEQSDLIMGLKKFNKKWLKKLKDEWMPQIVNNVMQQIKHCYLDNQYRSYDDLHPFINPYFSLIHTSKGQVLPALNNGWVMNADSSQNMVTTKHFYYLRRKVNVWGDLIRIRYGDQPGDSPSWEHMRKYIQKMAQHFNGFRLDNLHGTQLKVAQYLIKQARKVNPQIIIFAELFTNSTNQTALFTRKAGINSTLKEMIHSLSGEGFIKLFHKIMGNSGHYVGSLSPYFIKDNKKIKYLIRQSPISLIYDITHDNNTYQSQGLTVLKTPICLILQLTGAFIGSTKGFDQFYSEKILVTQKGALYLQDESVPARKQQIQTTKRTIIFESEKQTDVVELFGSWNSWKQGQKLFNFNKNRKGTQLQLYPGVYQYKFKVNGEWTQDRKKRLNQNGNHQVVIAHKHNRTLYADLEQFRKISSKYRKRFEQYRQYYAHHDGDLVFLLRQKKSHDNAIFLIANISTTPQNISNNIQLPGVIIKSDVWHQSQWNIYQGLKTSVDLYNHSNILEHFDIYHDQGQGKDVLCGGQIPPGFACLLETRKKDSAIETIKSIKQLKNLSIRLPPLGTLDYNIIMHGADAEQRQRFGISNYVIPSENRKLIFGGFGGIIKDIERAKRQNNLSLGIFNNIREGNWLLDYYVGRLKRYKTLQQVTDIIQRYFQCLKCIPNYLKPKYFTTFIYNFCSAIQQSVLPQTTDFSQKLVLASHQFFCSFQNPNPLFKVTLSAGLVHFCTGWSRSWGRDTFTCNQLLLRHPNIYRDIILQFASTLRHGMIPNLLDFGNNSRFNCRDACWWFIRSINEYAVKTKDYSIFKMKVKMQFLSDDLFEHKQKQKNGQKKIMKLQDIIQEIFQSHANGISYRQWNAGYQIDQNMKPDGFIIKLEVDENTGFIVGGNTYNCLTWMDKMGSSARANNKGYPATPRAGSPIQLTALLYNCLRAYEKLHKQGHYTYKSVEFKKRDISFTEWAQSIKDNFDTQYYISDRNKVKQAKFNGIYRDVVNVPKMLLYESPRLRPNGVVAMALAPDLFQKQHAQSYLRHVQKHLIFPESIGVSTLASAHQTLYSPFYDNSDDSAQLKIAHGFSYHNGPQWVWIYGFYVAAKCIFEPNLRKEQLLSLLQPHAKYIIKDDWCSLPQITDYNGRRNKFTCDSQAWSISSMLLALDYIQKYGK